MIGRQQNKPLMRDPVLPACHNGHQCHGICCCPKLVIWCLYRLIKCTCCNIGELQSAIAGVRGWFDKSSIQNIGLYFACLKIRPSWTSLIYKLVNIGWRLAVWMVVSLAKYYLQFLGWLIIHGGVVSAEFCRALQQDSEAKIIKPIGIVLSGCSRVVVPSHIFLVWCYREAFDRKLGY